MWGTLNRLDSCPWAACGKQKWICTTKREQQRPQISQTKAIKSFIAKHRSASGSWMWSETVAPYLNKPFEICVSHLPFSVFLQSVLGSTGELKSHEKKYKNHICVQFFEKSAEGIWIKATKTGVRDVKNSKKEIHTHNYRCAAAEKWLQRGMITWLQHKRGSVSPKYYMIFLMITNSVNSAQTD